MTTGIKSAGVDLDAIFDPYEVGTSPGLTGYQYAGADIHTRYAPLVYGIQAPATHLLCKVGGAGSFVDLNTLFAKIGTAKYTLPINGRTYLISDISPLNQTAQSHLTFTTNTNGSFTVISYKAHPPTYVTMASGTWNTTTYPASAMQALYTVSIGPYDGDVQAGSFTINDAVSWTSVTRALNATDSVSAVFQSGTKGNTGTLRIQYRITATGQVVSDSTIYFEVEADGST